MMRRTLAVWLCLSVLLLAAGPAAAGPDATHWRKFVSSTGFEIRYPQNWFRFGSGNFSLDIVSTRHRQEATIIPGGAQMIGAIEEPPSTNGDYKEKFRGDMEPILSEKTIQINNQETDRCHDAFIFVLKSWVANDIYQLATEMYCKIGNRVFRVDMVQWADDPYSQTAYEIALAMMRSLRADPNRPALKN